MKRGLVIGKFYPPHQGHQFLIESALSYVDELTIIVTGKHGQKIGAGLRGRWLSEMYTNAKVKVVFHNLADDDDEK